MMKKITEALQKGRILVSDGAWGTFLQNKGLKPGECPELWNINHPDDVLDIALSYVKAGANMIETNSFGGNSFKLSFFGLDKRVAEINRAAAEISRKAAGNDKFVLGSIGPTGKILMMGEVTEEELYNSFREQAMALESGGADALVIETMSDLDEAKCAIRACKENTRCEIICTMTFEKSAEDAFHTMMGVSPSQMVNELIEAGAEIIGANCGNGIKNMVGITNEIRVANTKIPILIHANAGSPIYKEGKTIFPETPEQMAGMVTSLIDAGANIIGGCCGTTPEHIRQIAHIVENKNSSK
jgi:5-methyltetrahydrofolate--homocysteine methyltransferase